MLGFVLGSRDINISRVLRFFWIFLVEVIYIEEFILGSFRLKRKLKSFKLLLGF